MASTQASPVPNSDCVGNKLDSTYFGGLVKPNVIPDSENFQISEMLEKYVAYLRSIRCPRVRNSKLLDGVDRVSQTIAGCIELAETALEQSKTHQTPEEPNPGRDRTGDIFSGLDQVDSLLAGCVQMAEDTGDSKKWKDAISEPHWEPEKTDPQLDRLGKPISGTDRAFVKFLL